MLLAFDWSKEGPIAAYAAFAFVVFLVAIVVSGRVAHLPHGALRRVIPIMFLAFVATMFLAALGASHFHKG